MKKEISEKQILFTSIQIKKSKNELLSKSTMKTIIGAPTRLSGGGKW